MRIARKGRTDAQPEDRDHDSNRSSNTLHCRTPPWYVYHRWYVTNVPMGA